MGKNKSDLFYSFIVLLVLSIFFFIGHQMAAVKGTFQESQMILINEKYDHNQLLKILLNNLSVGLIILIGSAFYTLLSFATVGFTGLITGVSFGKFSAIYGVGYATILLLPHGLLEAIWLTTFTLASIDLSKRFLSFLKKDIEYNQIFKRRTIKIIFLSVFLVLVSAIIEVYISPNLLFYLNN